MLLENLFNASRDKSVIMPNENRIECNIFPMFSSGHVNISNFDSAVYYIACMSFKCGSFSCFNV